MNDNHDTTRVLRSMALAAALAAAALLAACSRAGTAEPAKDGAAPAEHAAGEPEKDGHDENEKLTLSAADAARAGIEVQALQATPMSESVVVTATIRPDADRLARVAPRIEGRITAAPAKLGDRVRAGQPLATLDSVGVGEAHAAWLLAQSELRIAEADFERAARLNAEEIIARKDYLRSRADRDKAAAALRAAADKLRLLGGSPNAAGSGVSSFAVTAPFDGTVVEKAATLGELGTPGEPMFTVADLSRVWIQADLPEAALAKVRVGAAARVSVPAYPSASFTGRVDHLGAMLDEDKRTVPARIVVANADGRLKPGMFATATIDAAGEQRTVLALPDTAIVLMQGLPTVFVHEDGGYAMRIIEPGERSGGRTVVKAGLNPGERVVTAGAYALKARKLKSQLGHGH